MLRLWVRWWWRMQEWRQHFELRPVSPMRRRWAITYR